MRKLVAILACLVFMFSCAMAEDYSKMSDEELQGIIDAIRSELLLREPSFGENYLLYDENDIQIYLTGTYSARAHSFDKDVVVIEFDAILINNSGNDVYLDIEDCYVNGWSASSSSEIGSVKAGKKAKGAIRVNSSAVTEKGVGTELEEIEWTFRFIDPDNYKNLTEKTEKTVRFPLK